MPSTRPRILEKTVTNRILNWLRKQPKCFAYKVHGHPGQMTGVPDISCVWDSWSVWIEVKSPDNPKGPTDVQLHRMAQIEAAGGIVIVARSLAQVQERLAQLGPRKREKSKKGKKSKESHLT